LPVLAAAQAADTVLMTKHLVTMTGSGGEEVTAGAVAIVDGRIAWVGDPADAAGWQGENTKVVDYSDQAILPGFIDAHGHVSFSALGTTVANVASPPVGPVETIADLQNTLQAYISSNDIAAGEWVIGMGYDDSLIRENRHPDRDDLDAVSADHPILLVHVSGHLAAANSRALARGGINAESEDPAGGIIRRRPGSNEPNGVLEETATYKLRAYMSAANTDPVASVTAALEQYASYGITTAQDGAAGPDVMALLEAAAAQEKLIMDVVAYPIGMQDPAGIIDAHTFGRYDKRLKTGGIKLMLDGSPQGKTAFLSKPYHVPPHGQPHDYAGYPIVDQLQADALAKAYVDAQVPIIAHANGDAAAEMLIDAIEAADPQHDHRTVMIHAQTVREDQLTRMKSLRMIPSYFSAHTFYWGDWHRDSVLGEERGRRISPTASTQQRGMVFTVHNDAPIVPPDMIRLLWATTNRQTRSGQTLGPEQRVSIYEALRAMTIHAAYQHFEEDDKGTIEVGKQADLAVLSQNPNNNARTDFSPLLLPTPAAALCRLG
jgi:predicted amidohydrolase YtcJ